MKRKFAFILLAALVILGLWGCMSIPDDESIRSDTEQMLSAITTGDVDTGYALISDTCTEADFVAFCRQAAAELGDLGEYTLTPIRINQNVTNGISQTVISYRLVSGNGEFLVQAMRQSDVNGLAGFHISREVPVTTTGTLTTMNGADWIQWLILIAGLAGWAFIVWMIVDCARRPVPKKWLWILLILLCQLILTFTVSQGHVGVNFNLGIYLTSTALIRSSAGETMLRIVVPLGAVIYRTRRKKLLTPKEAPAPLPEQIPVEEQE